MQILHMRGTPGGPGRGVAVLLAAGLLAATSPAAGGICVTRDPSGAISYTNSPPPGARCERVVETDPPGGPAGAGARPAGRSSVDRSVSLHSERYGVSKRLVEAVIQAESAGNPAAVSPKGALGIMQLMPQTARRFDVSDPMDPHQNIEGGVRYLAHLLDLYGGDTRLALAAYNAGEAAVARYGGIPPYRETQDYVRKVIRLSGSASARPRTGAAPEAPPPAPARLVVREGGLLSIEN